MSIFWDEFRVLRQYTFYFVQFRFRIRCIAVCRRGRPGKRTLGWPNAISRSKRAKRKKEAIGRDVADLQQGLEIFPL